MESERLRDSEIRVKTPPQNWTRSKARVPGRTSLLLPQSVSPTSACVFQKSASLELFTSQLMTRTSGRQRMFRVWTCRERRRWKTGSTENPAEAQNWIWHMLPSCRTSAPLPGRFPGSRGARQEHLRWGAGCHLRAGVISSRGVPSVPLSRGDSAGIRVICETHRSSSRTAQEIPDAAPACHPGQEPNLQHPLRRFPTD